jgi:hypothetical protein
MPSFTSDSDFSKRCHRPDRFTIILLGTFFVILALLEFVSRARFDSTSRVERREMSERKVLLDLRDNGTSDDPHIAMVGNSLMLEGTDLHLLRAELRSRYVPIPYFVLGTNYYDWFFGLKRLFAEGMRPEYILLGLSPNQLASSEVRGDISARYMIQRSDLLDVVRQTHMDATRASEFILAHYSEYYSTRDITRGYVMSRVLPSVGELLHNRYAGVRDPELGESVLKPLAASRLAALDQLCRANGARLLFVVPPTYQEGAGTILAAGQERGITVLVPVKDNEFDGSDYQEDGLHMNRKGAEIFTKKLAESLNRELPE